MKPEHKYWNKYIEPRMRTAWDAQRHEDKISLGIPDVSFGICSSNFEKINGWIELKYVKEYPKRETTPVKLPHFTPFQRNWLKKRQRYGGNCWLLFGVHDDNFIFEGNQTDGVGKTYTKKHLYANCFGYYKRGGKDFRSWLTNILTSGL